MLQVILLILLGPIFCIRRLICLLNFDNLSVCVAVANRQTSTILRGDLFRSQDCIIVNLICLTGDEEDSSLPSSDCDVRQLRDLVHQDNSSHAFRDFFSAVCSFQENDLAFDSS